MNRNHFNEEIKRLRTQWPNAYGDERLVRVWKTFERTDDAAFTEIVNMALDRSRTAPLTEELSAFEQEYRARRSQFRPQSPTTSAAGVLEGAARKNRSADPDFVKACLQHLRSGLDGKINKANFEQGCEYLFTAARQLERSGKEIISSVDAKMKQAGEA